MRGQCEHSRGVIDIAQLAWSGLDNEFTRCPNPPEFKRLIRERYTVLKNGERVTSINSRWVRVCAEHQTCICSDCNMKTDPNLRPRQRGFDLEQKPELLNAELLNAEPSIEPSTIEPSLADDFDISFEKLMAEDAEEAAAKKQADDYFSKVFKF